MKSHAEKIKQLESQGVTVYAPESVFISDEVRLEQLRGPKTILYPGTRLFGDKVILLSGCELGQEAPMTVENCALGYRVKLKGGYAANAVFLDDSQLGSAAHVREGTLVEEQANTAHAVGLKQTILFPYVTLGSLINFCDVFMAGGTSRKDHSEVGSSFIHFNFTPFGPSGDKATPSLIGDVARGVMLRQPRIFLGGQGGLVGPLRIGYGTMLAAGTVYRRDYGEREFVVGEDLAPKRSSFIADRYIRVRDKVEKNVAYIANLSALWHWYRDVRIACFDGDDQVIQIYQHALTLLEESLRERIKRLEHLAESMAASVESWEAETQKKPHLDEELKIQRAFAAAWPKMADALGDFQRFSTANNPQYQELLQAIRATQNTTPSANYLNVISALDESAVSAGTTWLETIVQTQTTRAIMSIYK